MKKLVLFIGLVVAMLITITQPTQLLALDEQQTTQQVDVDQLSETEAERIIDKYTGKISVFFENLARDLTPVAEATYKSYVRYLWADIITGLGSILFIIILFSWFGNLQFKTHKKALESEKGNKWFDGRGGPRPISCVLYVIAGCTFMASLFLLSFIPQAIRLAISPEIVVAKEVLNLL